MWSQATSCMWQCFGLDDSQRSCPASAILWFYDPAPKFGLEMALGAIWEGRTMSESQLGIWALPCKAGAELTLLPSQVAAANSCCCKSSKLLLLPIFCPNKPHPSHADLQTAFRNMKGPLAQFNNVISSFIIGFQKTLWLAIFQETEPLLPDYSYFHGWMAGGEQEKILKAFSIPRSIKYKGALYGQPLLAPSLTHRRSQLWLYVWDFSQRETSQGPALKSDSVGHLCLLTLLSQKYQMWAHTLALQWFVKYRYHLSWFLVVIFSLDLPKPTLFNKVDMVNLRLNFFYGTLNECGPYHVSWLLRMFFRMFALILAKP